MKRPKLFRYVSSIAVLVAVAFVLGGCGSPAENLSPGQSTTVAVTTTQAATTTTGPTSTATTASTTAPTTTTTQVQTRVVVAEMFTGDW